MPTIEYEGKKVVVVPGQLILDSRMNVFGLHLFMESTDKIPEGVPDVFAFEHRGIRIVIDRNLNCESTDESLTMSVEVKDNA